MFLLMLNIQCEGSTWNNMQSSVQIYYILTVLKIISYVTILCRISVTEDFHVEDCELYSLLHLVFGAETKAVIQMLISGFT
jgi:hypothetical protein